MSILFVFIQKLHNFVLIFLLCHAGLSVEIIFAGAWMTKGARLDISVPLYRNVTNLIGWSLLLRDTFNHFHLKWIRIVRYTFLLHYHGWWCVVLQIKTIATTTSSSLCVPSVRTETEWIVSLYIGIRPILAIELCYVVCLQLLRLISVRATRT